MRRKTQEKKEEILKAASEIFKEFGFERASMSKISSRLGGSKATLYNYFSSKEELFFEVISIENAQESDFVHKVIDTKNEINDLPTQLYKFGKRFLNFVYSKKMIEIRRLTISQSGITDLGKITYKNRVLKSQEILSKYLNKAIEVNKLKKTNTDLAAKHFFGLLESEILYPFLFKTDEKFTEKQMNEMAKKAVNVFILAYGI
ncbi:TetR family transcriptional regulator [Halarcobacter mediterraneus]|uniref:TetR family transcriptional regulator n=1 Tax=Halarcobacter mediterraneus TaxID=2023153 RepID=A0A4Q1AZH9_9BACT|nr:TetR/AcrR family transcriptional regulator [Halarcobacter mediterraneus]RXK14082.1 TetR family transcriptional regulator [Halarcobacter mediterraneus]